MQSSLAGSFRPAGDGMNEKATVPYEEAPLRPFHLRVTIASFGGVFSDGAGLGIVGMALNLATPTLGISPLWMGLLGGASLFGLFLGALLTGPIADRHGRRPVFAWNMLLLALASAAQFFVQNSEQLLVLRLLVGLLLGTDYVVSKALLTEFTPGKFRASVMSTLAVAWAGGYAAAYAAGYAIAHSEWLGGPDAWRYMLLASAIPCALIFPLRTALPESPMWLAEHGHADQAAAVVRQHVGADVLPPPPRPAAPKARKHLAEVLSPPWGRRSLVACVYFTTSVIPYFAIGTFVNRVLEDLHVEGAAAAGLVYNLAIVLGAIGGLLTIDRMPRRTFLNGTYLLSGGAMLALVVLDQPPTFVSVGLFAVFASVLSASSNLVYVYLPELFPTGLRASGLGLAIASSRVGSAISTFLLPVVVGAFGIHVALGACVAVLALGGGLCYFLAPETRGLGLSGDAGA